MNPNVLAFKVKRKLLSLTGEKIYDDYAQAKKDCPESGYENNIIIELIKKRGAELRRRLLSERFPHINNPGLAHLIALLNRVAASKKTINVLDFGGADGGHYLLIKKCINPAISLRWCVVETPPMAAAMKDFANDELFFETDIDAASRLLTTIDIVYTSSTLQYTPQPYEFLKKLCNLAAAYMVFNRQSLTQGNKDLITVQRSLLSWHGKMNNELAAFKDKQIRYPHTNIQVIEFEKIVQVNYQILYSFEDNTGVKKVNNQPIVGTNYVVKRI